METKLAETGDCSLVRIAKATRETFTLQVIQLNAQKGELLVGFGTPVKTSE